MADLRPEQPTVLLRTSDRSGCLPEYSLGSVCKSCSILPCTGSLDVFNLDRSAVQNGTPRRPAPIRSCSIKMNLGPTPPGSKTNHTIFGPRPETEHLSVTATTTPRTTNRRLHDQDSSSALAHLTGSVIQVDSLTITGGAVFRRETSSCGPGGAFQGTPLREESPDKEEAICELTHNTSPNFEKESA
jgi:hypothetical protein